jgi:Gluconate 2-dehydrogenase subunit 3
MPPHHQESRIVAISAEHLTVIPPYRTTEPAAPSLRLQQLIDNGAVYVAQNLSPAQFATLQAIAAILLRPKSKPLAARIDAALNTSVTEALPLAPPPPIAFDYQLGLDELDTIARTRTGYAFAELPTEIQDAILDLIATRDLTTRKLDLALWLEALHTTAAAL